MNRKIRWGIIGAGGIARAFASSLATAHHGVLAAIGSRSAASAGKFATEFPGCRPHASGVALLADPEVDAVYIATPHPSHAEWITAAARAGKHVLCEKPFTMNEAEAARVFETVSGTGVAVIEAFKERFHPLLDCVAAALPQIGDVRLIEGILSFHIPFDSGGRHYDLALGGGSILDLGCYPANFARRIAGAADGATFADPVEVAGVAEFGPSGSDVCAIAAMRFANGILAHASCGMGISQGIDARIYGADGCIHVPHVWSAFPPGTAGATLRRADGAEEKLEVVTDRSVFALEADALAETAAAGRTECPAMSWGDTLSNMRTLDRWRAAVGLRYAADTAA